jgi:hypothetical protein
LRLSLRVSLRVSLRLRLRPCLRLRLRLHLLLLLLLLEHESVAVAHRRVVCDPWAGWEGDRHQPWVHPR